MILDKISLIREEYFNGIFILFRCSFLITVQNECLREQFYIMILRGMIPSPMVILVVPMVILVVPMVIILVVGLQLTASRDMIIIDQDD